MRAFGTLIGLASAVTISTALHAGTAHAQNDTVYLVTYVELMPNAVASGAALLKQYRNESRKQSGNLRFDVLTEIKRPDRFAVVEVRGSGRCKVSARGKAHDADTPRIDVPFLRSRADQA